MPITAEHERRLLNHYGLNTLYPESWPKADEPLDGDASDEEDDDDDGIIQPQAAGRDNMRKSRFWNIDRHASVRSASSLGPDGLVQKDEADALGMLPSVASELRRRGLPVEDDLKLRNRFMLSSTTFSPTLYLAHVHHDASSDDLLRGLDFLSRSIEQKSASLKVLVESNFEKFVKAKATIDNVYTEMRTHGADGDPEATPRQSVMRPHSRHASRGQAHFRNTSGPFSPAVGAKTDKRKNALTKESEYGVSGIKAPLQDVAIKAEEVWGPALGGREKEEMLKQVLGALEKHREIFNLPGVLADAERNSDYDAIIANWKAAQKYANRARNIADIAKANGSPLAESEVQQILITAKMWHDVSSLIETFKKDVWRRLKNSHGRRPAAMADESDKEEHMELISVLLQIGVNENPIWQWLHSRYLYLKDRIARSFERSRIEIEIMRRKLAANNKQDVKALAQHLKSASDSNPLLKSRGAAPTEMDAPAILAFWEKTLRSLTALLTSPDGLLGEVLDFWETTQSFIDNKAQKAFPAAVFASGLEYIELEPDEVANLRSGTVELIAQIRDSVMSFFNDAPVEDLSELYSPIPPTPITPDSVSGGGSLTPSSRRALAIFDATNVPPPSPIRGDPWENFAFWPPYSNALSGSHYLAKILALVGTAACEMAGMSVIKQTRTSVESLKTLVGAVRERCVTALTAAWTIDAGERCKYLESWTRAPERKDLTTMPSAFMAYEEKVLGNFQKVAYISDAAAGGSGGKEVLFPPPAKLLQSIRGCFVNGLYKTLSAMVENAERAKGVDGEKESGDPDGITTVEIVNTEDTAVDAVIDGRNRVCAFIMSCYFTLVYADYETFAECTDVTYFVEPCPFTLRDHPTSGRPIRVILLRQAH